MVGRRLPAIAIAMLSTACATATPTPSTPAAFITSSGISLEAPAGSTRIPDPTHDLALRAELVPGRTFTITIDAFPAAARSSFPGIADYGRIAEESVTVRSDSLTNGQGFDIDYRRYQGSAGDFNLLAALAVRGQNAVLVSVAAPDTALDATAAAALAAAFRKLLMTLR